MIDKSERVKDIVKYLQDKYGAKNIIINDHWEAEQNAIGLTDKAGQFLAYISTINQENDDYYLALESPPVDKSFPYSDAGDFDKISLIELEGLLTKHLRLTE